MTEIVWLRLVLLDKIATTATTVILLVQNSSKTTKKFFTFDVSTSIKRPSSEEAGTRSSSDECL